VIVLEPAYDDFVGRLVEATRSLAVGPPEDAHVRVGPVITADALVKIEGYIEQGKREATLAAVVEPPEGGWPGGGYFVAPTSSSTCGRTRSSRKRRSSVPWSPF